ncbi:hypothetical protein PGT21_016421 [Puccinia graminis f. sp. tritici]|uniref:Uncharacterized protein n=1 Tax=Puccinia graminis f. sp. tritici TaxID=56615 RepID=A0A5B0NNH7_PUCGR|nr:hypothetical protein PGT21_016421 [Puccinia graminis f. sp. tritici]
MYLAGWKETLPVDKACTLPAGFLPVDESNDVVECEIYVKQEKEQNEEEGEKNVVVVQHIDADLFLINREEKEQNEEEGEKNVVVVQHIDADLFLINRVHISANLTQLGGLKTDHPRWRDRTGDQEKKNTKGAAIWKSASQN